MTISKCKLFQNMNLEEVQQIIEQPVWTKRNYNSKEIIIWQDEKCDELYLLIEGDIKTEISDSSGKILTIAEIEAPALLLAAFVYGSKAKTPVTAYGITKATFLKIHRNDFLAMMHSNIKLLENFLKIVSTRTGYLSQKIRFLSMRSIRQRIAEYLLSEMTKKRNLRVDIQNQIKIKRQILADLFGVSRPSLSRELSKLVHENILEIENRVIIVKQAKKLIDILDE